LPQKLTAQASVSGFGLTAVLPGPTPQFMPYAGSEFGPTFPANGINGTVVISDTGAVPPADPTGACEAIVNAPEINGNIAFIRRGICNFDDKVYRAQQAGAIAVIIANNVEPGILVAGGDSIVDGVPVSITIPTAVVSKQDGDALLAASPGVQVSFSPVTSQHVGTYGNQARLYAPPVFSSGSSVSHWTTDASPNLLMEPNINPALDRQLDITLTQMKDIGWKVIDIPFPHLTYESWKSLVFTSSDVLTDFMDDPDLDGVSNQEEYFFGNDPKVSDAGNLPVFGFQEGQADLVFIRSKLTTDLSYGLEKSTTLASFQPAIEGVDYDIVSTLSLGTEAEELTLRLLNPPPGLFLRLRITANP
jgi:hypothetical protein